MHDWHLQDDRPGRRNRRTSLPRLLAATMHHLPTSTAATPATTTASSTSSATSSATSTAATLHGLRHLSVRMRSLR
jgi:hypothetical protein